MFLTHHFQVEITQVRKAYPRAPKPSFGASQYAMKSSLPSGKARMVALPSLLQQLKDASRGRQYLTRFNLGARCQRESSTVNHVTEELYLGDPEFTLGELGVQFFLLKQFQDLPKVLILGSGSGSSLSSCSIPVIDAHRKDPSFFFTNRTGAPQGEELGLMKPLSVSSCSCSASSFILDGANLYGARAIGVAPGTKSIRNSTCRVGGYPGTCPQERTPEILEQLANLQSFSL
ncbi:hypothetical protein Tco_0564596 [Tanacetum coccineum]